MADRYPLIVDNTTSTIKELPSGDNLNLQGSNIVNAAGFAATTVNISGVVTAASLTVNTVDVTPIHEITTYYVTTGGNDSTGDGSASNPWATPHKAMEYLRTRRINVTEGYTRVTVNVGVGTYNFGLNQTAGGAGYIDGTYALSGGTGSGAFVAISTNGSATGAITRVKLLDPGTGYLASDTLGINTTTGSGFVCGVFHVGATEGQILGPITIDHTDGDQILITGADPSGIKPGRRGNHFYNQVGVGLGSDPAGTGPNYTWSDVYDSSSPAGAYPNPMANGKGNTDASNIYNRSILESYYTTRLYFQGCDGFVSRQSNPAKIDKFAIFGQKADGSRVESDDLSTLGITNAPTVGVSTADGLSSPVGQSRAGNIDLGNDISVHGFTYGIYITGGQLQGNLTTITNTGSVGLIANRNCYASLRTPTILNNTYHSCYSYGGIYYAYGGSLSNNGSVGALCHYSGFAFLGNGNVDTVGFGFSTIIANNSTGVYTVDNGVIRVDGRYNQMLYVYGNSTNQMRADRGGVIDRAGANITVAAAHGTDSLASPALNTSGNGGAMIVTQSAPAF